MDGESTRDRDELMGKIMVANNLLNQMNQYTVLPPGQEDFSQLMPHLSEIFGELASYIFFAPPQSSVHTENLVEYLRLQQEQTMDIWRFEAYGYLIDRLS